MQLPSSILISALLQVSFVTWAMLGNWGMDTLSPAHYVDASVKPARPVAIKLPEPVIIPQPTEVEPAQEDEPLASTTQPKEEVPQTPPVAPKPPRKKLVKKDPKPPKKEQPKPPQPEEPEETQKLKIIAAATQNPEAPTSPAALAENIAPAKSISQGVSIASQGNSTTHDSPVTSNTAAVTEHIPSAPAGNVDRKGALRAYKRLLFSTIDKNKFVPRAARRARLQGTVYLLVKFDKNGEIITVKVRKSSGHKALDEGAIQTIRSLKKLPAPPQELGWNTKSLTIPIRYKI